MEATELEHIITMYTGYFSSGSTSALLLCKHFCLKKICHVLGVLAVTIYMGITAYSNILISKPCSSFTTSLNILTCRRYNKIACMCFLAFSI